MDNNLRKAYEEQMRINDKWQKEQLAQLEAKKREEDEYEKARPIDKSEACGKISPADLKTK